MTQQRAAAAPKGDTVTLDLSGPAAHRIGAAVAKAVTEAVGDGNVQVSLRRKGCSEAIRQMAADSFSVVPELNECAALVLRGGAGHALAAPAVAAVAAALAEERDGLHTVKLKVVRGPTE